MPLHVVKNGNFHIKEQINSKVEIINNKNNSNMEKLHDQKEKVSPRLSKTLHAIRRFIDYPGDLTSGVTPVLFERMEQEKREKID